MSQWQSEKMLTAFLDRDGVINRKRPSDYVKSWQEFEFLPGVFDALRTLKQHGFRLIVVTNQRGISLGRFSENDLAVIHERMQAELRKAGGELDAIYYCPHGYDSCDCRKPGIGLFLRAQRDFPDIRFSNSFLVGDSVEDMEAGERLRCRKVLIEVDGAGIASLLARKNVRPDFSAPSLLEAVTNYLIPSPGSGAGEAKTAKETDEAGEPDEAPTRPMMSEIHNKKPLP